MSGEREAPAGRLLAALAARGWRLAVAESCTGGDLAAALTAAEGASVTFWGSAVVYSEESKAVLAGVSAPFVARHGAVSAEVTGALAEGIRERAGVEIGLAVTGWAGPESGGPEPVGTVYLGVSTASETTVERQELPGGRDEVRRRAVVAAIHMTLQRVEAT